MKLTPTIVLGAILLCWNVESQNSLIDSLESILASPQLESSKASIFNQLSLHYFSESVPTSKDYAIKALKQSRLSGNIQEEAIAQSRLSFIYDAQGNLDSANIAIDKSLALFLISRDSIKYANALIKKASLISALNNDNEAIEKLLMALKIGEVKNNLEISSNAANEIGRVFMGLGNESESIRYLEKSLDLAAKIPDDSKIIRACINLAIANDSVDVIKPYLNRAINLAKKNNLNRELTYAYNSLGMLFYYQLDQVDSSLYYKKLALTRAKKTKETSLIFMITKSIAEVYEWENIDSAEAYYEIVLNDFDVQTYSHVRDHTLRSLANIKYGRNEFKTAFDLLDSSYNIAKDRYRENMESKVAEANTLYETEKKEAEIANQDLTILKQKNNRNIILFVSISLLLMLAGIAQYFLARQKRSKKEAEVALAVEQEKAEGLKELAKAKDNLFYNVSHELRTPLTMIIGPLQDASKEIKNVPIKENVSLALDNSKRLLNLVNEILDLSKLDAQKLKVDNVAFSLFPYLKRVFGSFSSLAMSQRIILEDNFVPEKIGDLAIISDPDKIETICYNLISNAIKYSKGGDTISFILDYDLLEKGILSISIVDEGMGIDPEDQVKIFNRYFQSSDLSQSSGTGIGLALTKQLCELLNGKIDVQSEKGTGSKFNFQIPFKQGHVQHISVEETVLKVEEENNYLPVLVNGQKPNILIVEDDLQMAKYLEKILEDQFDCTLAYNGVQALNVLRKQNFDLISSDVMMPEMDGFEFREQLNKDPRIHNTPFILLTARNFQEDKLRGFRLGIDDYLVKPFNPDELKARVSNLIQNKISRSNEEKEELSSNTETLLSKIKEFVEGQIDNPDLKVADISEYVNYSTKQMGRLLKQLTGMSPVEFILEIRLQKAYHLLKSKTNKTVNEIRYQIGIESPSYFSTKFKKRFGVSPKDLM